MKSVIEKLRRLGVECVIYLDDILFIAPDQSECFKIVELATELLESLGFIINKDKCSIIPSRICKFLGFLINSSNFTIKLTKEKQNNIIKLINNLKRNPKCIILELSSIIGKLIAACPAVDYGWLYTKRLEAFKQTCLIANNYNFSSKVLIPQYSLEDLSWWDKNVQNSVGTIKSTKFGFTIFTDASNTGWGAKSGDCKIYGFWDEIQKSYHINYKELLAIKLAILKIGELPENCSVLLRVDNTTAISYINKMGSTRYPKYNKLAREIWQQVERKKIFLFVTYINTKDNIEADSLPRISNDDTEWELCPRAYELVISTFGCPEIDLFANTNNKKCDKYVSWYPDGKAYAIDAFTLEWSYYFYAFSPFSIILRTLSKIKKEQTTGIVIVPDWPSQPWYLLLKSLTIDEIFLKHRYNLLLSPNRSQMHPQATHLSMMVVLVSRLLSRKRTFQRKL